MKEKSYMNIETRLFLAFFWLYLVDRNGTGWEEEKKRSDPTCILAVLNNEICVLQLFSTKASLVFYFFSFLCNAALINPSFSHTKWFGKTEVSPVTSSSETI